MLARLARGLSPAASPDGRATTAGLGGLVADGAIAGAVGSAALNMVTYLDMAVRARPASTTPEESARRLSEALHIGLGPEAPAANRRSGLGPLLGYTTGVLCGVVFTAVGLRRLPAPAAAGLFGVGLMAATDTVMTVLKVTDPRRWSVTDWISDVVPHLVYGAAAVATLEQLGARREATGRAGSWTRRPRGR
jgi:xanthosine utilization system XapX-like protein